MQAGPYKILLLSFLLISSQLSANECGPYFDNFTSPICTNSKYIFWTGVIATASLRIVKDSFVEEVARNSVAKDHFGDYGKKLGVLGDGYLNGIYFFGQLLFGGKKGNIRAEHMLEASFYSLGTTLGIKEVVHETRPGYRKRHDSFPSGHSAFSFTFASVVTAQHGWDWLHHRT